MEDSTKHANELEEVPPQKRRLRPQEFRLSRDDKALIQHLSVPHSEILSMEGSYEKISHDMGIPTGTVKSRIHRARAALTALRAQMHSGDATDQ